MSSDQPFLKIDSTAASRSSSRLPLLMTARMRSVAASGASVKPVLRTRAIFSASASFMVSVRSEGSEREIRSDSYRERKSSRSGFREA